MKQVLKVTQAQKDEAQNMMLDAMDGKVIQIETAFQHQVAERLIAAGVAQIETKKNYGRIASIRGVRS